MRYKSNRPQHLPQDQVGNSSSNPYQITPFFSQTHWAWKIEQLSCIIHSNPMSISWDINQIVPQHFWCTNFRVFPQSLTLLVTAVTPVPWTSFIPRAPTYENQPEAPDRARWFRTDGHHTSSTPNVLSMRTLAKAEPMIANARRSDDCPTSVSRPSTPFAWSIIVTTQYRNKYRFFSLNSLFVGEGNPHTMQRSPDVEAQVPRAGQYHISASPQRRLMFCLS